VIDWLYTLPEPVLVALPATFLALLIVFLPRLLQRLPVLAPSDANTDFALRIQTTLFTMTSLVLTFTLVQADINLRQVDAAVSAEAARIDQLDRLLTRYGNGGAQEVRPLLRAYARSIVEEEWPAMLHDHGNENTRASFAIVSRRILAIAPAPGRQSLIFGEMLKSLDSIAESRASRLNMLGLSLPGIYWAVVLFAISLVTFASCTVQQTPFRTVLLSAQAAVLGAFVGFVLFMDHPFKGQTAVGPDAIVQVIAKIDMRRD
jgi:hypothetical protein